MNNQNLCNLLLFKLLLRFFFLPLILSHSFIMESVYTFDDSEESNDKHDFIANQTISNAPSLYLSAFGSRKVSTFQPTTFGGHQGSRPDLSPTVLEAYAHKK